MPGPTRLHGGRPTGSRPRLSPLSPLSPLSALSALPLAVLLTALAGCGAKHRLSEYDFSGRTVAVRYYPAPAPSLWTGGSRDVPGDDALSAVLNAGSRVAREVEGRRARARLDSAATRLDLSARMADRTLERAALYLGARAVKDAAAADYVLEVDLHALGLDAGPDRAYMRVRGEAVLLDRATGTEVWWVDVNGWDALTPGAGGGGVVPDGLITAGMLTTISVDEFQRVLERLTDFVGDRMTRELREDLRDARRR